MAGECLSYGAFGAYSTIYNLPHGSRLHAPINERGRKRTESWKNFLPACRTPSATFDNDRKRTPQPSEECYDHELNAGIHGE